MAKSFGEVICPKCNGNIRIEIKDYIVTLYECQNNHIIKNILLNEYPNLQKIANSKILCNNCNTSRQNQTFYKCNSCKINICQKCIFNHNKSHRIINYEQKNSICLDHMKKYISYCNKCKKNLCELCEKDHNNHDIIYYKNIIPDNQNIKEKLKELKSKIEELTDDINKIISILNNVKKNMEIYFQINLDILNSYWNKSINFQIIQNANYIKDNNINIVNDINQIIYEKNINNKFNNILKIYNKMKTRSIDDKHKITIKYKIDKNINKIRLFGSSFVTNNKDYCKIIYDNEEYELKEEFEIKKNILNKEILEIKLIVIHNITKMKDMFDKCDSIISLSDISNLDTSYVVSMHGIFANCSLLSNLPDISKWDISNVTDISWMFYNCKSLCSLPDISKWNISKVNDISGMFSDCSSLIFLPDISKWKTNNIKIMNNLFNGCSSLLLLPDISKWNISNVTNLDGIFSGCFSLSKIPDISKWDTSNVTDMSLLFEKCSSLVTLPDISKWNTKKVYNINYIFSNCLSLSSLPDISKWDISKLIQKEGIFIGCSSLLSIPPI